MTITSDNVSVADGVEVSPELLATANELAESYIATITEKMEAAAPKIGEPQAPTFILLGDFDVLATTPIQFIGNPPFKPGKIIAGGETALIIAILHISGFNKTVLSERDVRINLERVNLTNVTDVSPLAIAFTVPPGGTVNTFTPFFFFFVPPAPPQGKPDAIEAIVTADVLDAGMPYAAFATTIFDFDANFGPRVNELNRYLVYKK